MKTAKDLSEEERGEIDLTLVGLAHDGLRDLRIKQLADKFKVHQDTIRLVEMEGE